MMVDAFCVYHHFIISITKRLLFAILFIKLSYLSAIYDKSYGCMIYRHIPLFTLQTRHITPRKETKNWAFTGFCHKIEKHRISHFKKNGVRRAEGGTRTHTLLTAADFESAASANSATSACVTRDYFIYYTHITILCQEKYSSFFRKIQSDILLNDKQAKYRLYYIPFYLAVK